MGELNIGSMAIFLGYADRCPDRIERLWPAELIMIASPEGEGAARSFPVDEAGERLPGRDDELVWKEEVLPLPRTGILRSEFERAMINAQGARRRLADLLKATGSRLFNDIRNRGAFIYVTGMFPTHLRPEALGFLVVMTEPVGDVLPLCGRGPVRLSRYYFDRLLLETHPMVETVREQIANGWEVCAPPTVPINGRRSSASSSVAAASSKRSSPMAPFCLAGTGSGTRSCRSRRHHGQA